MAMLPETKIKSDHKRIKDQFNSTTSRFSSIYGHLENHLSFIVMDSVNRCDVQPEKCVDRKLDTVFLYIFPIFGDHFGCYISTFLTAFGVPHFEISSKMAKILEIYEEN